MATQYLSKPSGDTFHRSISPFRAPSSPSSNPTTAPSLDDRSSLSVFGHEISRPSSVVSNSTYSSSHYSQVRHASNPNLQLPALSALANAASSAPEAGQRNFTIGHAVTYAATPSATPGGNSVASPVSELSSCGVVNACRQSLTFSRFVLPRPGTSKSQLADKDSLSIILRIITNSTPFFLSALCADQREPLLGSTSIF